MLFVVCTLNILQYYISIKHLYCVETNTFQEQTTHNEVGQYVNKAPPEIVLNIYYNQYIPACLLDSIQMLTVYQFYK